MKEIMRKPTYSEIYMYKSLVWLGVAAFIFCPIFNNVVLKVITSYVASDIAYEWLILPLLVCQAIFSFVPLYLGFGVLVVCVVYFGANARSVIILAFVSRGVDALCTYAGEYVASKTISSVSGTLVTACINTLALVIVYLAVSLYAKKKNTYMPKDKYVFSPEMLKHPFTGGALVAVAAYVIFNVVTEIINNVVYFNDPKNYYSIPDNIVDILLNFGLPYLLIILLGLLGFAIMLCTGLIAQSFKKSGKEKYLLLNELNKKAAE